MKFAAFVVAALVAAPSPQPKCPPDGPIGDMCRQIQALTEKVQALQQKLDAQNGCGTNQAPVCCPQGDNFCPSAGCTSLSTDPGNCGACGVSCGSHGDACAAGACRCGNGPACAAGHACVGGSCVGCGLAPDAAMESCAAIHQGCSDLGDGVYWINPGGAAPFQAYCDMTTDGGGWTLAGQSAGADDPQFSTNGAYRADALTSPAMTNPGAHLSVATINAIGKTIREWNASSKALAQNHACFRSLDGAKAMVAFAYANTVPEYPGGLLSSDDCEHFYGSNYLYPSYNSDSAGYFCMDDCNRHFGHSREGRQPYWWNSVWPGGNGITMGTTWVK